MFIEIPDQYALGYWSGISKLIIVTMKKLKTNTGVAIALPILTLVGCGTSQKQEKPNVILILTDDMGYSGITAFGGQNLHTPALDKLAENGVICTNFYSNAPVSSPTRAAIMTGSYQQRVGLNHIYSETDPMDGLDPAIHPTFVTQLQNNGYRTGVMGKWHLGQDIMFNPLNNGFDTFHGYTMGNIDFISHYNTQRRIDWWYDKEVKDEPGYVTDLINKYAVDFIKDADGEPFFLYVAHNAIHVPMQGRNDPPIRTDSTHAYRNDAEMTVEEYQRVYREMIAIMDEGVQMMVDELEKEGILDNTLIIFTSDNGAEKIAGEKYDGANGYFNGYKGTLYEGGIHVPAIFYYPKTMKHRNNDQLMTTMDLMPTILEFCGIENQKPNIDGISLLPTLTNECYDLPERNLFWSNRGWMAMRSNEWKLVRQTDKTELFNMLIDPKEQHDLSSIYPEKTEEMKAVTETWWNEVTAGTRLEGTSSLQSVRMQMPQGTTPPRQ